MMTLRAFAISSMLAVLAMTLVACAISGRPWRGQLNGAPVVLVSYDEKTGAWHSNPECFRMPDYLRDRNASTLWSAQSEQLHHKIDSPAAVRRSALFPAFEADAMIAMIEHEPFGEDNVADLILMNYKMIRFAADLRP